MISEERLDSVMWYKAPSDTKITPNRIPDGVQLVELIVGGVVYFSVGGVEKTVTAGGVFWHIAGDYTVSQTDADNPYECIVFRFRGTQSSERRFPRLSWWKDREEACEFGEEMLSAYYDESTDRRLLSGYAYSRLAWNAHRATARKSESAISDKLMPLMDMIDSDPCRDMSIIEMSMVCDISVPHLHALFRDQLQATPHQYLLVRRLRHARHLIVSTDDPFKRISNQCGFKNIETFYRSFKKRFSVSPGEFRRANRPY